MDGYLRLFCIRNRFVLSVALPTALLAVALFVPRGSGQTPDHSQHQENANKADQPAVISGLKIPDVELIDQSGKRVRFYSDLVKGKTVAINTIFTTCTTICPLMGANFAKASQLLAEKKVNAQLISISIDPLADTPQRLKQWSAKFGQTGPGWTLVTGKKSDVELLLKSLQVFTANKVDHAPTVLIGGEGTGEWSRVASLLPPERLVGMIESRRAAAAPAEDPSTAAARSYFTDVRLMTQKGESVRLYSDLLKDKVVVINAFFRTCTGACPKITGILAGLQDRLGDQLGKDVFLLSFSVDPEADTPRELQEYADQFHAKPGWLFLTGPKANVDVALAKLGQKVARKEDHLTMFIIGNNKTGLWKKVFAPDCTADTLKKIVDSVLNDKA